MKKIIALIILSALFFGCETEIETKEKEEQTTYTFTYDINELNDSVVQYYFPDIDCICHSFNLSEYVDDFDSILFYTAESSDIKQLTKIFQKILNQAFPNLKEKLKFDSSGLGLSKVETTAGINYGLFIKINNNCVGFYYPTACYNDYGIMCFDSYFFEYTLIE